VASLSYQQSFSFSKKTSRGDVRMFGEGCDVREPVDRWCVVTEVVEVVEEGETSKRRNQGDK
jgi:hypothetical protein